MQGRLTVSEIFFEVPKDYDRPSEGTLRLFARSMERFEKPVTPTVEPKQQPWCECISWISLSRLIILNIAVLYLEGIK